jgi:hypothetical protein
LAHFLDLQSEAFETRSCGHIPALHLQDRRTSPENMTRFFGTRKGLCGHLLPMRLSCPSPRARRNEPSTLTVVLDRLGRGRFRSSSFLKIGGPISTHSKLAMSGWGSILRSQSAWSLDSFVCARLQATWCLMRSVGQGPRSWPQRAWGVAGSGATWGGMRST